MEQFVKKLWGYEYWFANVLDHPLNYCGKLLFVEYGKWSSEAKYHYHKKKDETFFVLEGMLQLDYVIPEFNFETGVATESSFKTTYMEPFQTFRVTPFMKHRFTSVTLYGCKFVEVSTFHSDEDSFRCYYNTEIGDWVE